MTRFTFEVDNLDSGETSALIGAMERAASNFFEDSDLGLCADVVIDEDKCSEHSIIAHRGENELVRFTAGPEVTDSNFNFFIHNLGFAGFHAFTVDDEESFDRLYPSLKGRLKEVQTKIVN